MTTTEPRSFVDDGEIEGTPEIVEQPPSSTAVERHVEHTAEHSTAIEAAAEAAVMLPGVPGRDEFMSLAMQARILSLSGAAPKAVRDNPHLAFHVAMVGRDLGISPSASLELIDVIQGRFDSSANQYEYRLSLSPQLLNGQLRRLGLGSIVPFVRDDQRCIAVALEPGGRVDPRCAEQGSHVDGDVERGIDPCRCRGWLGTSEFTWEQARRAELVGPNCTPGNHTKDQQRTSGSRSWKVCGCNQGYITYPERMLWWRASGFAADDYFPEAGLGLYSPEALGAVVDEDGRPIDPASVELPEGYGALSPGSSDDTPSEGAQPGDPERQWEISRMIHALPVEQRAQLAARWKESTALTYERDGKRSPYRPHELPVSSMAKARSMVESFLANAVKATGSTKEALLEAVDERLGDAAGRIAVPFVPLIAHESAPVSPSAAPSEPEPSDSADAPRDAETSTEAPLPLDERALYVQHVRSTLDVIDPDEDDHPHRDVSDDDVLALWETVLAAVDLEHGAHAPVVDEVIEQVKAMTTADVRAALASRLLTVPRGTADARRALAERIVRERIAEGDA